MDLPLVIPEKRCNSAANNAPIEPSVLGDSSRFAIATPVRTITQCPVRANFKMVDRFCQPFSGNTSRNKGVLHALVTCASGRFVDNLCAKRPRRGLFVAPIPITAPARSRTITNRPLRHKQSSRRPSGLISVGSLSVSMRPELRLPDGCVALSDRRNPQREAQGDKQQFDQSRGHSAQILNTCCSSHAAYGMRGHSSASRVVAYADAPPMRAIRSSLALWTYNFSASTKSSPM